MIRRFFRKTGSKLLVLVVGTGLVIYNHRINPISFLLNASQPSGECPPGYEFMSGDVAGPGTVDNTIHSSDNITHCEATCKSKQSCLSFEYSQIHSSCAINKEYYPTNEQWDDAAFCSRTLEVSQYVNPVIYYNHPDPGVLRAVDGSGFIAVTTSNYALGFKKDPAFPIYFSKDLVTWTQKGWVFPGGKWPTWTYQDVWAPEIHFVNGQYVIIFAARQMNTQQFDVGVAFSKDAKNPFGPYEDLGEPFIVDKEGAIDPHFFVDPVTKKQYLLWKNEENAKGLPSSIYLREMDTIGFRFKDASERIRILSADRPEENNVVEGPWLIYRKNRYYLIYAASWFAVPNYYMGVARADKIEGPYNKSDTHVVKIDLERYNKGVNCTFEGPGHGSVVQDANKNDWLIYHAWSYWKVGQNPPGRMMLLDKLVWNEEGWPQVHKGVPSDYPTKKPNTDF